jgi:hypothetical protein
MKQVSPFKSVDEAFKSLDNGGRLYNIFTKANDNIITSSELSKAGGGLNNKFKAVLYLEMVLKGLTDDDKKKIYGSLNTSLKADYDKYKPELNYLLDDKTNQDKAILSVILEGKITPITDWPTFSGYIPVPSLINGTLMETMSPIKDNFDIFMLSVDHPEPFNIVVCAIQNTLNIEDNRMTIGGILSEYYLSEYKNQGKSTFLEGIFYS